MTRTRDLHGLDVLGAMAARGAPMPVPAAKPAARGLTVAQYNAPRNQGPPPTGKTALSPSPSMSAKGAAMPGKTTSAMAAKGASQAAAVAAAKAKALAKMQADAAATAQRLAAAASKISKKHPREAKKLSSIANVIKQHAKTKIHGSIGANTLRGDVLGNIVQELMGLTPAQVAANAFGGSSGGGAPGTMSVSTSGITVAQILSEMAQWDTYNAAVNAAAICGDLINTLQPLVVALQPQPQLAYAGTNIINRCSDVINDFDPNADPPDPALGPMVQSIQSDAASWISQAQSALGISTTLNVAANAATVQQAQQLITSVQLTIQQLTAMGNMALAQTGQNIILQLQALIATPNDPNLPNAFAQIQNSAASFQQQAQQALMAATPDSGTPDAGGGGGGGGGGDDSGGGSDSGGGQDDGGGYADPGQGGGGGGQDDGSDQGGGWSQDDVDAMQSGQDEAAQFSAQEDADESGQPAAPDAPDDGSDPNDIFSDVVGEIMGRRVIGADGDTYTDFMTVTLVQKALKAKGFDPGGTDGTMGPRTAKAIRLMQAAGKYPETGVIDDATLGQLMISAPKTKSSSSSSSDDMGPTYGPSYTPQRTPALDGAGGGSWLDFFHNPIATGSQIKVWQVAVGAGVAVTLSTLLMILFRKRGRR